MVLVTSQVTYVPGNYQPVFDELLEHLGSTISALFVIRIVNPRFLAYIASLYLQGCRQIPKTILKNMMALPLRRREILFKKQGIPVFYVNSINEDWVVQWLHTHQTDLLINLRARIIYQNPILEAPKLGCLNVHHGLLPQYRGAMCDLWDLANNQPTGFTIHKMTPRLDDGDILAQQCVSPSNNYDYLDYLKKVTLKEASTLVALLKNITHGHWPTQRQNICDNQPIDAPQTERRFANYEHKG